MMKKYFYYNGQDKLGPVTFEELKLINIKPDTLIWFNGQQNWIPASELTELKPILELSPPPIIKETKEEMSYTKVATETKPKENPQKSKPSIKVANEGWITAGFIFSFLGGFIGVIIGCNFAFGNYKRETKRLGWVMIFIGAISSFVWKNL